MPILKFASRKLVRLALLLLAVSVISFILVQMSPIDPVKAYVGADMMVIGPEQQNLIAERWGLDESPVSQYFHWLNQLAHGNLGTSTIYNQPVSEVISHRFVTSLWLMLAAWTLAGVIGFTLGVISGSRQGSWIDRGIRFYAYTLASSPTFWVGLLLLTVFSVKLGWTPICCASPPGVLPGDITIWQRLHHLILPALTLSIIGVANITLHTRQKLIEVLQTDYVLFARAQGESRFGIIRHHGVRNIALPAITLQFASISELFGGAVLAEQVFTYPGLGQATIQAGLRSDVPLLLGIVLFSAVFVFIGNTIADILYQKVDPRVRIGEGT